MADCDAERQAVVRFESDTEATSGLQVDRIMTEWALSMRKWHRWIGWTAALFLLLVSTTGIILQGQRLFGAEETERERLQDLTSIYTLGKPLADLSISISRAQQSVLAVVGDAPLDRVVVSLKGDRPTITLFTGGPGAQMFVVGALDGAVVRRDSAEKESFLLRLHTGEVFGDSGILLGLLWGTAMLVMTLTGVYLYLKMRRPNRLGLKRIFWALALVALSGSPARLRAEELTGQYLATGNVSAISTPLLSLNNRLGINYAPSQIRGSFDWRAELYNEPSFHSAGHRIVTEHKREVQLNYSIPLNAHLTATAGYLYHDNATFRDRYFWALAGLTLGGEVFARTSASITALAEKRDHSDRVFFDYSGSIGHRLTPKYGVFASGHLYQNMGESDLDPTDKREYEVGVNFYPSQRYVTGLSYFRHTQVGDPDDRFALIKLKVGVSF